MMKRITRYVLADLLTVFAFTLTGMTGLMIIVGIAQEAVRQGLGPVAIVRLIPYVLPNALLYAVPGTMLFSTCSVYGRMSATSEVVAVKSLGISPLAVISPALVLAFALSLVTVWLNDVAVSWGRRGMSRVIIQSVEEIAYGMLRTQGSYTTKDFSILVRDVEGRRLIHPMLVTYSGDGSRSTTLIAEEAELRSDLDKNVLVISLRNGKWEIGPGAEYIFKETDEYEIPLRDASHKALNGDKPSNLPLRRIGEAVAKQQAEIERIQQSLAALAAFQMASGDIHGLTSSQWHSQHQRIVAARQHYARLRTVPWRRWANGFSCFCFVMVGVPWAIIQRSADVFSSFGKCFVPILVIYYPLLMYGVDRAKTGAVEPYTVWLGNVTLVVVGVWLLNKVMRY